MQPTLRLEKSYGSKDLPLIQALRYEILRKPLGLPASSALFQGDDFTTTIHLLAYLEERLVGCATLLTDCPAPPIDHAIDSPKVGIQLRGMAVSSSLQGTGIGKHILTLARQEGMARHSYLWCNARVSAIPFYAKQGWLTSGSFFDIPVIGRHVVMIWKPELSGNSSKT